MTEIPADNKCPVCNYKMECATALGQRALPKPGDISICLRCQSILVFDEQLRSRNPTGAEIEEFKQAPELWQKIHKCRYYIKELT